MQTNVTEYFQATLARFPHKTAVVDQQGTLTFAELDRWAWSIAIAIESRSQVANRPVAVYLPKCKESVATFLGILRSGNCYAPLDVASPAAKTKTILGTLETPLVITREELLPTLVKIGFPNEKILVWEWDCAQPATAQHHWQTRIDTDPVYIIHTSGSTGKPKGVVISHRGVVDYIDWALATFPMSETDVIGSQAPFHFDNSTLDLYLCLATGATLDLIPENLFSFPLRLLEHLDKHGITFIFWVPSIMVNVANTNVLDKVSCPHLNKILFAGEVMPNKQLNVWRRRFPQSLFANLYGPTEITVDCTYFIVDREFKDDEPLPIGFPCRNTDILILNEQNQPAKMDEPGELCVRGTSLALGYWNNPEKTAQAFVQNPLNPHYPELIYRTGDLVYRNVRGEIMFTGRKDFQIKHLGYRIELGEIEHAVLNVEGMRNCCVVYNKDKKEITLFFEADRQLIPATIRERLSAFLPKYMLPTVFHQLDTMPRNPNGKIDRQQLLLSVAAAK